MRIFFKGNDGILRSHYTWNVVETGLKINLGNVVLAPGAVFTTLHFLCNLQNGPVRLLRDKTLKLSGPIYKL